MSTPTDYEGEIGVGGSLNQFDDLISRVPAAVPPVPGLVKKLEPKPEPEPEPRDFKRRGAVPSVARKQQRIRAAKRPLRGGGLKRK